MRFSTTSTSGGWQPNGNGILIRGLVDRVLDFSLSYDRYEPEPMQGCMGFGRVAVLLEECRNVTLRLRYEGNGMNAGAVGMTRCRNTRLVDSTIEGVGSAAGAVVAACGEQNELANVRVGPTLGS